MAQPNGAELYRGPSMLDGSPIVVIATGLVEPSSNEKTGPMVQTWILRADVSPVDAASSGADAGICGQCPLRPLIARALDSASGAGPGDKAPVCYVNKGQGPAAVWAAWKRGLYPVATPAQVRAQAKAQGLAVRFGAYGDPAAAPLSVWAGLTSGGRRERTGYTHQWRTAPQLAGLCMASVGSAAEALEAQAAGWRTYRVRQATEELLATEMACPASPEGGHRARCSECRLCDGRLVGSDRRQSVAIVDHGVTGRSRAAKALAAGLVPGARPVRPLAMVPA